MLVSDVEMLFLFNRPQLLATGDGAGDIQIWKLKDDLTKHANKEDEVLEELASAALE